MPSSPRRLVGCEVGVLGSVDEDRDRADRGSRRRASVRVSSWAEFAEAAPEFAAAGARLLTGDDGVSIAFLATARAVGPIHLAPVCPIFCASDLYLSAVTRSPKLRDLRADGRYALHAFLGANDEEFQLRGSASEVGDPGERTRVHDAIPFPSYDPEHPVFRFSIERALWTYWESAGEPGTRAIRRRWPELAVG